MHARGAARRERRVGRSEMGDCRRAIVSRICVRLASAKSVDMLAAGAEIHGAGVRGVGVVGEWSEDRLQLRVVDSRALECASSCDLIDILDPASPSPYTVLALKLKPQRSTMTDDLIAEDAVTQAHNADIEYFVRRGMTKGYQFASLLTPVVYTVFATTRYGRSHININRLLRATWMGGSLGASPSQGLFTRDQNQSLCRYRWRRGFRVRSLGVLQSREGQDKEVSYCIRRELCRILICICPIGAIGLCQTSSLRADDHSTIGGMLFAVITPALFWKRANSLNCESHG